MCMSASMYLFIFYLHFPNNIYIYFNIKCVTFGAMAISLFLLLTFYVKYMHGWLNFVQLHRIRVVFNINSVYAQKLHNVYVFVYGVYMLYAISYDHKYPKFHLAFCNCPHWLIIEWYFWVRVFEWSSIHNINIVSRNSTNSNNNKKIVTNANKTHDKMHVHTAYTSTNNKKRQHFGLKFN